jgi:hypothetical protein
MALWEERMIGDYGGIKKERGVLENARHRMTGANYKKHGGD